MSRIDIVAETVHAVHSIRSNANKGQRITGGFVLHFRNYSTPFIIHNVDPYELKRIMEDSLNPSKVNNLRNINRENVIPGIGIVSVSRNIFEWKHKYNVQSHELKGFANQTESKYKKYSFKPVFSFYLWFNKHWNLLCIITLAWNWFDILTFSI